MTRSSKLMCWIILGMATLITGGAQAYSPIISVDGEELRWNKFNDTVDYYTNVAEDVKAGTGEILNAIGDSFDVWEDVSTSAIKFSNEGPTDLIPGDSDGINVVGFVDSLEPVGTLGLTLVWSSPWSSNYFNTEDILEADILFPAEAGFVFSTTEPTDAEIVYSSTDDTAIEVRGVVNFNEVAIHEIGHFCGLGHSFVDGFLPDATASTTWSINDLATMWPYANVRNGIDFIDKTLHTDDIAGVSHLYPESSFSTNFGVIEGKAVWAFDQTEPVFGAHVVAVNSSRKEVVGVLSQKDGSFLIDGLAPGEDYSIFAEPVSDIFSLDSYYWSSETDFPFEYYDDSFEIKVADALTVTAGKVTGPLTHTLLVGVSQSDPNEPNDDFDAYAEIGLDRDTVGVIAERDVDDEPDVDIFRFRALRDTLLQIDVKAGSLNTMLKPELILYDYEGNSIASNSGYLGLDDARIYFRVPKSGFYFIEVRDTQGEEGPGKFYILSLTVLEEVVPILSESDLTPVFSFELTQETVSSQNQLFISSIQFDIETLAGEVFSMDKLAEITDSLSSGISVFNDSGVNDGVFDYDPLFESDSDKRLPLAQENPVTVTNSQNGKKVLIKFLDSAKAILPLESFRGPDFHVIIRTSDSLNLRDHFKISIPTTGIVLKIRNGDIPDSDPSKYIRVFDDPIPAKKKLFTGEILEIANYTPTNARVPLSSQATAMLEINAKGDPLQEYFLSELKFWIIGYSAQNYTPFYTATFRSYFFDLDQIDIGDSYRFNLEDLMPITYDPNISEGSFDSGIAVYRDKENVEGGIVQGDGKFDPEEDAIIPFAKHGAIISKIPVEQLPDEFLLPLIPPLVDNEDLFGMSLIIGDEVDNTFDFAERLAVTAYEVTLRLDEDALGKIPSTDDSNSRTSGPDFFVTIQTSSKARNMDRFIVYIPDEGITIENNFGQEPSTIKCESLAFIDPTIQGMAMNAITVRPDPSVKVTDLTKTEGSSRVIQLPKDGGGAVPIMALDMSDFGMSCMSIPQGQGAESPGLFFNQGYIWDTLDLDFQQGSGDNFEATDLLPLFQQAATSNGEFSMGIVIYVDDDTFEGNGEDEDNDGFYDEELLNGRDDDLDGLIDEDVGDGDPAGINGVFDPEDDPWIYLPSLHTYALSMADYSYTTAPVFPLENEDPNAPLRAHFDLMAHINAEARSVADIIGDPWTLGPGAIFLRTGYAPVWGSVTHSAPLVAYDFPDYTNGKSLHIDNPDADDGANGFQPLWDVVENAPFRYTYTYDYVFPIPDDVSGVIDEYGVDRLAGDDVFITLRASDAAQLGDNFHVSLPSGGIGLSVYHSPMPFENNLFPVDLPSERITTEEITIGSSAAPPEIEVILPGLGENLFEDDYSYEIVYAVTDIDSARIFVDVFLDTDNLNLDGLKLNQNGPLEHTGSGEARIELESSYTFKLTDPHVFEWLKEKYNIEDILQLTEQARFYVYISVRDAVNDEIKQYSQGYIIVQDKSDEFAKFIRLDSDGSIISSFGFNEEFSSVPATAENPAIDIEILPNDNALLALLGDGSVYGRTLKGSTLGRYEEFKKKSFDSEAGLIKYIPNNVDFGVNMAVDLEIVPEGPGYYILTLDGVVHPVGNVSNFYLSENPPPYLDTFAKDMELVNGGKGAYVLDAYGVVHVIGEAQEFPQDSESLKDIMFPARDLLITPSEEGYYVLLSGGAFLTAGDAVDSVSIPGASKEADFGYVGLELTAQADGLLAMQDTGQITSLLEARIGPDFLDGNAEFIDIEVVGQASERIGDIIDRYFDHLADENINGILDLLDPDYMDDHGNDKDGIRDTMRSVFDFYLIGASWENPITFDGDYDIAWGDDGATVIANATVAYRIPEITLLAVEEALEFTLPFEQTIQIYELADGRGDELKIYDFDKSYQDQDITEGLAVNKIIYRKSFKKREFEGPSKVRLKDEGSSGNNLYVFTLTDGGAIGGGTPGPANVNIVSYGITETSTVGGAMAFEFELSQDASGAGYLITSQKFLHILPTYVAETSPFGFSISKGGPVIDFQVTGQEGADFYYDGTNLTFAQEGISGIADLTGGSQNITELRRWQPEFYEELQSEFVNTIVPVVDNVYLILSRDKTSYILIKVLEFDTDIIFDWKSDEDFVIPP